VSALLLSCRDLISIPLDAGGDVIPAMTRELIVIKGCGNPSPMIFTGDYVREVTHKGAHNKECKNYLSIVMFLGIIRL
jgi:hypothetical protein